MYHHCIGYMDITVSQQSLQPIYWDCHQLCTAASATKSISSFRLAITSRVIGCGTGMGLIDLCQLAQIVEQLILKSACPSHCGGATTIQI